MASIKYILIVLKIIVSLTVCEDVEWAFLAGSIVPDIVNSAPKQLAFVEYPPNIIVRLGNELTPVTVKMQPEITWEAKPDTFYCIFLTSRIEYMAELHPTFRYMSPNVIDRVNHTDSGLQFHHWLVVNAKDEQGDVVYNYLGPSPPRGAGLRSYVFLVFEQPSKLLFDHKRYDKTMRGRSMFTVKEFARKYRLGPPVAGNFFISQFDYYVSKFQSQITS